MWLRWVFLWYSWQHYCCVVNITWLLLPFAKCCLKKMASTVCHYCDYCAITSFKCSQETFNHDVMNNWIFYVYPVAFTVQNSKTRLVIQVLFATWYFIIYLSYSFISWGCREIGLQYVKPPEVNQIKGSNHSMNILLFASCVCCCTDNHKLNTCTYCFIQRMYYCFL